MADVTPRARQTLVVGAFSSIGNALLRAFAERGDRLLATGRRDREVYRADAQVSFAQLDLLDLSSLDKFTGITLSEFGNLDVVVFLAGILPGKPLADYEDNLIQEVLAVNFSRQASLLRRILPSLNDGAHVIFVSSISGERGSFDPIYAASKAAQIAFVKSLATWHAPRFRVNAISPGLVQESGMYRSMSPSRRNHHLDQTPTKRLTNLEDLADIIVGICEPEWNNLNGEIIRINGGLLV